MNIVWKSTAYGCDAHNLDADTTYHFSTRNLVMYITLGPTAVAGYYWPRRDGKSTGGAGWQLAFELPLETPMEEARAALTAVFVLEAE